MKKSTPFRFLFLPFVLIALSMVPANAQEKVLPDSLGHARIVQYLQETGFVRELDRVTLWTTPRALDSSHVVRHMIKAKHKDIPFPFEKSWLVMIDDHPGANFGHPVRWIFIDAGFTQHTGVLRREFPPIVLPDFGKGKPVEFRCWELTPVMCEYDVMYELELRLMPVDYHRCKYAILVSGGANSGINYSRYAQNLKSMYTMLRNADYSKGNIFVYYADGTLALDCDNEDGDNDDATGNDVTDGAFEDTIRAKFREICSSFSLRRHVLFSYFTNHGSDDDGVCLWDVAWDGLDDNELYSPDELADDVANSRLCRHFMIHDQCYSGDFLPMASDGDHDELVVYAAASASESSYGREYMARWEQNDMTTTTVNDMHQDVVDNGNLTSTPGMSEGTVGVGDHPAGRCCFCWWCWRYWYIAVIAIAVVVIILWRRL